MRWRIAKTSFINAQGRVSTNFVLDNTAQGRVRVNAQGRVLTDAQGRVGSGKAFCGHLALYCVVGVPRGTQ